MKNHALKLSNLTLLAALLLTAGCGSEPAATGS